MQRFRAIETLVPHKAASYGEPIRRLAVMARAGISVPQGFALSREQLDPVLAAAHLPAIGQLLRGVDGAAVKTRARGLVAAFLAQPLDGGLRDGLRAIYDSLEGGGARALTLSAVLVCDKPEQEQPLGGVRLGLESREALIEGVRHGLSALFDPAFLEDLHGRGVRDCGVSLLIQRMVDGLVSGVVFTRHPVTGDTREWLVRAGYGLSSRVRRGEVTSDVMRVARDGFVRDVVICNKATRFVALADGSRVVRSVPVGLREQPALTEALLPEVLSLATRVERHLGSPVCVEWALQDGKVHLLRAELLPTDRKPVRERTAVGRDRELWSRQELGEALPEPLSPLTWSLLRRFSRMGLSSALSSGGAALPSGGAALVMEVRGRAHLNLSVLTDAVCQLPGVTPRALSAVGIEGGQTWQLEPMGLLDLPRAALRLADAQVRFERRLPGVVAKAGRERAHFADLDTRLMSPHAVERVLCDVETWLGDAGLALMRCYGLWVTALLALRTILNRYYGPEAPRLERDLLWGPDELQPAQGAATMLALARRLAGDERARAWSEGDGGCPDFVVEALRELTLKHRYEGMGWMDPGTPRASEVLGQQLGVLRVLVGDPMALAIAFDRAALVQGRRERADREWKRRVAVVLWPVTQRLIARVRLLTQQREELLVDAADAVTVLRDIVRDASRRLSMREPDLGEGAAFFLHLDELHGMLSGGGWDVRARIAQRRIELSIAQGLPASPQRFVGRPRRAATSANEPLCGSAGAGGAAEGRVLRVLDGSELVRLPRASVLVVRACDVGLASTLPAVRGVIAECGGMLSHGAMLASALGVPVVVGVSDALTRLADGERVRVDGDRACVERLATGRA